MRDHSENQTGCSDGKADALAAIALVAIVLTTVIYWLSNQ